MAARAGRCILSTFGIGVFQWDFPVPSCRQTLKPFCHVLTWSRLPSCCGLHRYDRSHRLLVYEIPPQKIHGVCGRSHICFGWYGTLSSLPQLHVVASQPIRWFLRLLCRPAHVMDVRLAIDHLPARGVTFRFTFRKFT